MTGEDQITADITSGITIGGIDLFIRRVAQRTDEVFDQADRSGSVGSGARPVSIPDEVDVDWIAFHDRAVVIIDTVARDYCVADRPCGPFDALLGHAGDVAAWGLVRRLSRVVDMLLEYLLRH